MPLNTREIHKALLEAGLDVPGDATRFRYFMAEVVRKGIVKPPTRIPAPDGGRGKVGSYDDDTIDRLTRYLRSRSEAARVKSELIQTARPSTPTKRRLSVSFWVPEDLAIQLDGKMRAGHPLAEMLFDGIKWLQGVSEKVRNVLYADLIGDRAGSLEDRAGTLVQPGGKWSYIAALSLASLGYQRAEDLAADLGCELDEILRGGVITFSVLGGRVVAHATSKEGHIWQNAIETEEG